MRLTDHLERAIAAKQIEPSRDYLGASIIGHPCMRRLYYELHAKKALPDWRTQLIFDTGHAFEKLLIDYLRESGINIFLYKETFRHERVPQFAGHVDAVIHKDGIPYAVLDIKTSNQSQYNQFVKHGMRKSFSSYYTQLQAYMGLLKVSHAVLLVLNKNTCAVHEEWTSFDNDFYESLVMKAEAVIHAKSLPPKINNAPFYYVCKMCPFNGICHGV